MWTQLLLSFASVSASKTRGDPQWVNLSFPQNRLRSAGWRNRPPTREWQALTAAGDPVSR